MAKMVAMFVTAIVVCLLVAGVVIQTARQAEIKYRQQYTPAKVETVKPHPNHSTMTKWVYAHSKVISQKTASEIVTNVLKYKHSTLMLAIFEAESEFVPTATSHKGALGLGQIHFPAHGKRLTEAKVINERRDLYDIEMNVRATNIVLSQMLKDADYNVPKALEAYLGGKDGRYVLRILTNFANISLQLEGV
jgi:soluble lytic murein transglycosylase-like protein